MAGQKLAKATYQLSGLPRCNVVRSKARNDRAAQREREVNDLADAVFYRWQNQNGTRETCLNWVTAKWNDPDGMALVKIAASSKGWRIENVKQVSQHREE